MIYNSIEEELWRIFTFYALHSDPSMPETLRPPNFIKLCKDCQIISKKFPPSSVELEIAKLSRQKSQGVDYIMSNSINFLDFMTLLEVLAVKIYPRDSGDVAAKRLILENVLLLANRRSPTIDLYDVNNPEGMKLITETFSAGLLSIFTYYTAKAHMRRGNAVSNEKMKQKEILRQNGLLETDKEGVATVISPVKKQNLSYLKNLMATQRDTISYKEYLSFCQDFSIRSTALLTATQLADVYLSIVPLQSTSSVVQQQHDAHRHCDGAGEGLMVAGMTFELFCRALMFMALLAYRNLDSAVPTTYKVKALLVYMLKCAVDGNRTLQVLTKERSHTLSATKGSLCLFGSTEFVTQFQAHWQREGYCDYTLPPQTAALSGTHMLRKVVGEAQEALEGAAAGGGSTSGRARTASNMSVDSHSQSQSQSLAQHSGAGSSSAGGGGGSARHHTPTRHHHSGSSAAWGVPGSSARTPYVVPGPPEASGARPEYPVAIEAADLSALLSKRPELVEFLSLEIAAMRVETERLTSQE